MLNVANVRRLLGVSILFFFTTACGQDESPVPPQNPVDRTIVDVCALDGVLRNDSVFMVAAAFKESWRVPIILYGMLEKGFMVFLYVSNMSETFSNGFMIPAVMDSIITLWSVIYFASLRGKS